MTDPAPAGGATLSVRHDTCFGALEDRLDEACLAYEKEKDEKGAVDIDAFLARYPDIASRLRGEIPAGFALPSPSADIASLPDPFGPFDLLGELGGGGMGAVYRGWDGALQLHVAVKVIKAGQHASADDRQRFLREARAVAALAHPNIVALYGVGEFAGHAYFSMELADGTLARQAAALRRNPRALAAAMAQVADAIHFAHRRGILHRDLKPANVLLKGGVPKVADFGLAKRIGGEDVVARVPAGSDSTATPPPSGRDTQTADGAVIGTPSYMSPEQARGDGWLTWAVDVYGLGAILYEMLTGRPPFAAATPVDTLSLVLRQDPIPPRAVEKSADPDLEAICLKCLRKDANRRYATAAEVADEFRRYLAYSPVVARPLPWWGRLRMWARRDPLRAALTGAASLLGLFAAVLVVYVLRAARVEIDAEKQRWAAGWNAYCLNVSKADAHIREAVSLRNRAGRWTDEAGDELDYASVAIGGCAEPYAGWESGYLRRLCRRPEVILKGHELPVQEVCYSPDGRRLLTCSLDRTARLWDLTTGKQMPGLGDHLGPVRGCFTPDGKRVVTCDDRTVRVWDADTGKLLHALPEPAHHVACVGPGGRLVTASRGNDKLLLYGPEGGRPTLELPYRRKSDVRWALTSLAVSPDGGRVAVCGFSIEARLLSLPDGQEIVLPSSGQAGPVYALAFSPDGNSLAVGHREPVLYRLPGGGGPCVFDKKFGSPGSQTPSTLTFSPDGKRLACAYRDGWVRVWDVETGLEARSPRRHLPGVFAAAFSPDGRSIAVARGTVVTVEELAAGTQLASHALPGRLGGGVSALAFTDAGVLAARGGRGEVVAWDIREPRAGVKQLWRAAPGEGSALLFHKGRLLSDEGGLLLSRDPADGTADPDPVRSGNLAVLAGGGRVAAALRGDREIVVVGAGWTPLNPHGGRMRALAIRPDGSKLVCGGDDGVLWLGGIDHARRELAPGPLLKGHYGTVHAVAWSRNGRWLASGGDDRKTILRDLHNSKSESRTLGGHGGMIKGLAFSYDGMRLATCSGDGKVKVWDVETGADLLTLTAGKMILTSVAFSRCGRFLAAGDADGTILLWDGTPLSDDELPFPSPKE